MNEDELNVILRPIIMERLFLMMLVFFTLNAPAQAADKIRISMTGFAGQFMTFPLAQKRGFLKEEGVEAEIVRISAAAGRAALTNGDIDYSTGIGGTAINGALSGIPIRVVACFVPAPVLGLVARPEFKIVQALKGKTIAILIPGGVAHFAARAIVKHAGLDPEKEMKYLAVGPPDARYAALTQGLVEAAILGPPLDFEARKQGYNILARADEVMVLPETGLVAGVKKIQDKPDEIKRVIRAGIKANRYILQNREGTIQVMMQWMRVDRDTATATYDGSLKSFNDDGSVSDAGLRIALDESRKAANITREVAFSEVADFSMLREAQRELGTK